MNAVSNKELMRRFYLELWGAGDLAVADELVPADFVDHMPNPAQPGGREGMLMTLHAIRTAFPDMRIEIESLIEEDGRVAGRWTMYATHTGELFGVPASGKQIAMSGADIIRWQDGLAREIWHIEDIASLMQQIGAMPAPGQ